MEIKGALTLPRKDEFWFDTGIALFRGESEQATGPLQKCGKCGHLYPESDYDCPNCGYSSGGD
jgi:rubrerythrin